MEIDQKQLFHLAILEAAEKFGDEVALIEAESKKVLTFSEFRKKCFQFAAVVSEHVGPVPEGESSGSPGTIMVLLPNCADYPVVFCGAALLGRPICGINPDSTKQELRNYAKKSNSKIVVCSGELLDTVKESFDFEEMKIFVFENQKNEDDGKVVNLELLKTPFDENLASTLGARSRALLSVDDVLIAPLSSGSTGEPKCVLLTHKNFNFATKILKKSLFDKLSSTGKKSNLAFLPFYHASGFWALCFCLLNGHQSIIMKSFQPMVMMEYLQNFKIDVVNLVPSLVNYLIKNHREFRFFDLSNLKTVLCGSAPIGKDIIKKFIEIYPHVEDFIQGYGMTEVVCLSHLTPLGNSAKDEDHSGSCGKLLEGFEAMIVDPETHEIRNHPNEPGELWLRSDCIMKGYLNDDEENSKFSESSGWLKTGDILFFDEDGFYYVVDRLKNMIKVNGMQVAPLEIENLILKLNFISEVSVIGIQDADAGEVPLAFVVFNKAELEGKMTTSEAIEVLRDFVHSRVASHKQLRGGIIPLEKLPKTSTGKVIKKELLSLAMAEHETVL